MLESMWIKRNPLALLVEMQMDSTTMEYSMQISLKKQTNKKKKLGIKLPVSFFYRISPKSKLLGHFLLINYILSIGQ